MVHALKDMWRVLVPHGYLIDLRPHVLDWPLEVVAGQNVMHAGNVDSTPSVSDDRAANRAVERVVSENWFSHEYQTFFDCATYWNTLEAMLDYYAKRTDPPLTIPDDVLVNAQQMVTSAGVVTKVRIRTHMLISRYRKESQPTTAGRS